MRSCGCELSAAGARSKERSSPYWKRPSRYSIDLEFSPTFTTIASEEDWEKGSTPIIMADDTALPIPREPFRTVLAIIAKHFDTPDSDGRLFESSLTDLKSYSVNLGIVRAGIKWLCEN